MSDPRQLQLPFEPGLLQREERPAIVVGLLGHIGFDKGTLRAAIAALDHIVLVSDEATAVASVMEIKIRDRMVEPAIATGFRMRRSKGDRHRDKAGRWR